MLQGPGVGRSVPPQQLLGRGAFIGGGGGRYHHEVLYVCRVKNPDQRPGTHPHTITFQAVHANLAMANARKPWGLEFGCVSSGFFMSRMRFPPNSTHSGQGSFGTPTPSPTPSTWCRGVIGLGFRAGQHGVFMPQSHLSSTLFSPVSYKAAFFF